jgi:Mg-chelatase subunit ChlD
MDNSASSATETEPTVVDAQCRPTFVEQLSSEVPTATAVPSSGVALTVTPEMSVYSTSACDALLGVTLAACPAPSDRGRAPVDCVVVTDVSGSMAGEKLALVQQTVKLLLDEFGAADRVGLVTFDTTVHDRLSLTAMDQKTKTTANGVVDSFRAGSSTNLSGGLFAGLQQLIAAHNEDQKNHKGSGTTKKGVKSLLLMTDGQANYGLRSADEIVPVLTSMLAGTGIALHTFGYGAGHDSTLLRQLASTGHGSYYFVESADDIRSAFGDCLGGLLSVVAQNLVLELAPLHSKAIIKQVHHKAAVPGPVPGTFRVPFADLYGDERRDVLVSFVLPADESSVGARCLGDEANTAAAAVLPVLRATLKYVDVLGARAAVACADGVLARAAPGSTRVASAAVNPELEQQRLRLLVADTLDDARTSAGNGDLAAARAAVAQTRGAVAAALARQVACSGNGGLAATAVAGESAMLPSFLEDLDECARGLANSSAFRSTSHKMAMMSEGHQQQRCMESRLEHASTSGAASKMRSNAYRTTSKQKKSMAFAGLF